MCRSQQQARPKNGRACQKRQHWRPRPPVPSDSGARLAGLCRSSGFGLAGIRGFLRLIRQARRRRIQGSIGRGWLTRYGTATGRSRCGGGYCVGSSVGSGGHDRGAGKQQQGSEQRRDTCVFQNNSLEWNNTDRWHLRCVLSTARTGACTASPSNLSHDQQAACARMCHR